MTGSPPHDENAERALLGAILNDTKAITTALDYLQPEHFFIKRNEIVYSAMIDMFTNGITIDQASLYSALVGTGNHVLAGGLEYIGDLSMSVSSAANIVQHARTILRNANLRKLISVGQTAITTARSAGAKPAEIVDKLSLSLIDIDNEGIEPTTIINDTIRISMGNIEEAYNTKKPISGVATGYADLDNMTGGLQADYIVLAARPSMGKSAIMLNLIDNICTGSDKVGVVFNLEMSKEALTQRFLSSRAQVNSKKLKSGRLDQDEWDRLTLASKEFWESKIYLQDGIYRLSQMNSEIQKIIYREGRIDLVCIDYLGLIESLGGRADNREQEVAGISRFFAKWKKKLGCPIIVLHQLNRGVEMRPNKKPVMSDLRESGSLEQDADMIWLLYRPDYYDKEKEELKGQAILTVAKQRNGDTGDVPLYFKREIGRFENGSFQS